MMCVNIGLMVFEYVIGCKVYIVVSDVREGDVYYVGFEDCVVLDNCLYLIKLCVWFIKDLDVMFECCFKFDGLMDKVYLVMEDFVMGVEVGIGCIVFV